MEAKETKRVMGIPDDWERQYRTKNRQVELILGVIRASEDTCHAILALKELVKEYDELES